MASFSYTNRTNFLAAGLADTLVGNSGADSLIFSATVALTDADFAAPRLNAARVDATTKVERLRLSNAASQVVLGPNAESFGIASVFGGIGADSLDLSAYSTGVTISGGSGNDTILGGDGNDSIDGSSGDDSMVGGLGNDYYIVSSSLDNILENFGEGTDTVSVYIKSYNMGTSANHVENAILTGTIASITGNSIANSLTGNASPNSLNGGAGNDTLVGGVGNDTLNGSTDADSMAGGANDDYYFVDNASDVVLEVLSEGTDTVSISTLPAYTLGNNVERLILLTDTTTGTGNSLANTLIGNSLANTLSGLDGIDSLAGGNGDDSLSGGASNDMLLGEAGADTLDGGTGNDRMLGGAENDYYIVDSATDAVVELPNPGTDSVLANINSYTLTNSVEALILGTASTVISGTGNAGANTLIGNSNNNSLNGVAGNDTLIGFAGNDTLNGGAHADSMVGGLDNDYYLVDNLSDSILELSSQGIDSVAATVNGYILPENVEFLILQTGVSFITAIGNSSANTIVGNTGNNSLFAGDGNDSIDGGSGNDTIYGGSGNDTLNGSASNDSLIGEAGNDYYFVNILTDIILELDGDGTDTASVAINSYNMGTSANHVENAILTGTIASITGNSIANSLTGNASANSLNGGAGNDTLVGGVGNDTLNGSTDADSMAGGANDDYYFVDNASDVVLEAFNEGTDTVSVSVLEAYTLGNNVERLILLTDTTTGTGNSLTNTLIGNSLANTLSGLDGADSLAGGNGDDSLSGGASNDTLLGEAGADTLDGGTGNDRMLGGAGNDYYIVDSATDAVVELLNAGTDSVLANINSYTLANSVEALILGTASTVISGTGNAGANTLIGNSNNNSLNGGAGADTLIGGIGNDYYTVDLTTDVVIENSGEGTDSVLANITGATLSDHVEILVLGGTVLAGTGNSTDNTLIGNASVNSLSGGAGNDSLYGFSGSVADTLVGGDGQDTLNGGDGNDSMDGGGGNDTYLVSSTGDVIKEVESAGTDSVIASVAGYTLAGNTEVLVLSGTVVYGMGNSLSNTLVGNSAANTLNGGSGVDTLIGGAGNDTYILDTVYDKVIEYDSEGTDLVVGNFVNSYTLAEHVENLQLVTGSYATGNSLNNSMTGNAVANTLDGGAGADTLVGGAGVDFYILDQVGDIVVESGVDIDTVLANYENHTLGASVENLILGTGILVGSGNSLANSISGNSLANSLAGDSSDDTLIGLADDDTLNGGTGNDSMVGGLGNDLYLLDSLSDRILESLSQGIDSVLASISGYTLAAHADYLELTGVIVAGTGNSLSNTLVGNSVGNSLDGGAGVDLLVGGGGNDTYFVDQATDAILEENIDGSGVDLVFSTATTYQLGDNLEALILAGTARAGEGNDLANTLTGNSRANTLSGSDGADTLFGLEGNDTLDGGDDSDADSLVGGLGNDYYIIRAGDLLLESSGEGTDSVLSYLTSSALGDHLEHLILATGAVSGTGNSLNNSLLGNEENNTLTGGAGADTFAGGDGDDFYVVADATDRVIELADAGLDTVWAGHNNHKLANHVENLVLVEQAGILIGTGNSLDNLLEGNSLANSLAGAAGNDTMLANDGNDTLQGGTGDDSLVGGAGNDLYYADSLFDSVLEVSAGGVDSVIASVDGYVLADEVEYLLITGELVSGSGNSGNNTLLGNIGHNSLEGLGGNDTILGASGNDTLLGGTGDDSLVGGTGDDFYEIDSASDVIVETSGAGADTILVHLVAYSLGSNLEHLVLGTGAIAGTGNALANSILGNSSSNSLDGGTGADTLAGGDGNDTYFVDSLLDVIIESDGEGDDVVITALNGFQLATNIEGLLLSGSATLGHGSDQDNTLTGHSTLANSLSGAGGGDTLIGGSGNDTLDGGADADSLDGGLGNDYYMVDNAGDVISDSGGTDTILVNVSGGFTLGGGSVIENLVLGTGDQITGNASNNSMVGNASNNSLHGGGGVDTLIGGLGDDYYTVDSLDDVIIEESNGGNDSVVANFNGYTLGANIENVILAEGVASISGGSTANYLVGNSIDNTLDGGGGADTLVGLDANDYYVVDHLADVIIETSGVSSGTDSVLSNISLHTLASNVEYLLLGSLGVAGIGNSLANTIVGNSKSNSLDGGDGSDSLLGGDGNNTLNGGLGIDTMFGGLGNDYFVVDSASDSLVGGGGNDGIITLMDGYTLSTDFNLMVLGGSVATAYGNSNNNTITGNIFSNTLHGGGGEDSLVGRTGHDYYLVDSSSDVVLELASEGTDTVEFSTISDYTSGNNVERLVLGSGAVNGTGNSLANILTGNGGANSLSGAAGNDSLSGSDGNDTLLGALATSSGGYAEIDTLTGGSGNDIFVLGTAAGYLYSDAKSNSTGITDYAYITDFSSGSDKLQIVGSVANYYLGVHSVAALTSHQGLFRELGTTDELIAILQGSPIATLDSSTVNWV